MNVLRRYAAAAVAVGVLLVGGCAAGGDLSFLAFTRKNCPPCARLHRDYAERGVLQFVDVDEQGDVAKTYSISSTPTIVAVDADGKEIERRTGYDGRRSLDRWVEKIRDGKR